MAQAIVFSALEAQFDANAKPFLAASKQVTRASDGLSKTVKRLAGVIAGAFAVRRVVSFGEESLRLYGEQQAAEESLAAALRTRGEYTDEVMQSMKRLASAMQEQLAVGDEQILQMMATARSLGVQKDQLESVVRASLDFARGVGLDSKSALITMSKALAGNVQMLQRYGIEVKKGASATEILQAVNERFAGQQEAWAKTSAGAMQRLANAWGDFKEGMGRALTEFAERHRVFERLRNVIAWLQTATADWRSFDTAMSRALGADKWEAFKAAARGAEAVVLKVWEGLQKIVEVWAQMYQTYKEFTEALRASRETKAGRAVREAPAFQRYVQEARPLAERIISQYREHPATAPPPQVVAVNLAVTETTRDAVQRAALVEAIITELRRQGFVVEAEEAERGISRGEYMTHYRNIGGAPVWGPAQ